MNIGEKGKINIFVIRMEASIYSSRQILYNCKTFISAINIFKVYCVFPPRAKKHVTFNVDLISNVYLPSFHLLTTPFNLQE